MKKFLILFSLIVFMQNAFCQDSLAVIKDDFPKASALSAKKGKIVFAMVYAEWCSHCNKMRKQVLSDRRVIEFYNKNFINLMMNSELPEGKSFMHSYDVTSYPQFLFLDTSGELIYKLSGEYSVDEFLAEGENAMNPKLQLPYLQHQFYADVADANHCLDYINVLKKGKDKDQMSKVAKKYLDTKKPEDLFNETDWKIIAAGVNDLQSKEFQFVLAHQKEFAQVSSPQRVENKIINVALLSQKDPMDKSDTLKYGQTGCL